LLVAHQDVAAGAIDRLLDAVAANPWSPSGQAREPAPAKEPLPEFPWHAGAIANSERKKPLIAADAMDWSEKFLAISATLIGGLIFCWQGLHQWFQHRRHMQFGESLRIVSRIDSRAMELERAAHLDIQELLLLQQELNMTKDAIVDKFARGEIESEQIVASFLTLVSNTRNNLTRLLLHERENLERRAEQGKAVNHSWPGS
jgi:hypothetical protein